MVPRPRFDKLDPDKRRHILDCAIVEFTEYGFHDASYNKIIERAGISKGAMYYYFDDKADLYATVLTDVMGHHLGEVADLKIDPAAADPFWDALGRLFEDMIRFTASNPDVARLIKGFLEVTPAEVGEALNGLFEAAMEMSAHLIVQGQALGAVRDDLEPELLNRLVFSLGETMDRWTFAQLDPLGTLEDDQVDAIVASYLDLFRRLLLPSQR